MDFLSYMSKKLTTAPNQPVADLIEESGGVEHLYLIYVDILKGFCDEGPLASDRVKELVEPVVSLTDQLIKLGLPAENIVFLNDAHPEDAVEFSSFAPHCRKGTAEAEVIDGLQPIQQMKGVQTFDKNATNGLFGTNQDGLRFFEWVEAAFAKGKGTFIVVGDCTDLCIYQNAMGIRLLANEKNADAEVVVPITHVKTFDIPVETADQLDIYAHDADFLDTVFLYHMQTNGVRIVSTISK